MTESSMTETVTISTTDDGQRLDRWIKKNYPMLSFGDMQKILRTGQIRVDGKRAKGDARLKTGQILRIPPQMRLQDLAEKKTRHLSDKESTYVRSMVLYQDAHIIVLNKPAGLATQGGSKVKQHIDRLLDGLVVDGQRPHLVHRLDRETSGLLLLARNAAVARDLGALFKRRDIRKYYWALTSPAPVDTEGRIKSVIAKVSSGGSERMMRVDDDHPEGKSAVTFYKVMDSVGGELSWVAFWPRTGRTHQIRVHALDINAPLVGDDKYHPLQPFLQERPEIPNRLYLHARRLIFPHPATGKIVDFTAPVDADMRKTFGEFGFDFSDTSDPFEGVE
jgi:23S rRNA pseudouridine955/2504/2580 synthase